MLAGVLVAGGRSAGGGGGEANRPKAFHGTQLSSIETIAHFFRRSAVLEADARKRATFFQRAMTLYTTVVLSFKQPAITLAVSCNKTQLCMSYPPGSSVASEDRRRISHCFAGMALCALMGERNPTLFFSYSSAALAWEPFRRIEMANVLRIHLLLVGKFDMQLTSLWEFTTNSMAKVDELMGFTNLPAVYGQMCKSLVLPMLLLHGTDAMVDRERGIVQNWDAAVERYNATACANCGEGEARLRCSACRAVYYCGAVCQYAHWKAHKAACRK